MLKLKDGACVKLSMVEKNILMRASLPLSDKCPASLRYELARFDADDICEAYRHICLLFKEGLIEECK